MIRENAWKPKFQNASNKNDRKLVLKDRKFSEISGKFENSLSILIFSIEMNWTHVTDDSAECHIFVWSLLIS